MRFKGLLVRLILLAAIAGSMVLSWNIWTNNAHHEQTNNTSSTETTSKAAQSTSKAAEVFLPTQVLWSQDGQKDLLYDSKESLVNQLRKTLKKTKSATPKKQTLTVAQYEQQINRSQTLTLLYPDNIPYKIFREVLNYQSQKSSIKKNTTFNRIQITFGHQPRLWLMNDKTKVVYQTTITNVPTKKIKALIKQSDVHLKVTERLLNKQPLVYVEANQKIAPHSYLISQQPDNYYVSTLFNEQDSSNIDSKEQADTTIYTDGSDNSKYRRLNINHKSGEISFTSYSDEHEPTTITAALTKSFNILNEIGNSLPGVRFYQYDEQTDKITFRTYIEGFPIFYQTSFGSVQIQLLASGQKIDFSNYGLQVPVPASEEEVAVPSTESVLNQLTQSGYLIDKISDVQLGYAWTKETTNNQVIDLTPTYFIRYDKKWHSLQSLLDQANNTNGGD